MDSETLERFYQILHGFERLGWTRGRVGKEVGLSEGYVSVLYNRRKLPTPETIRKLEAAAKKWGLLGIPEVAAVRDGVIEVSLKSLKTGVPAAFEFRGENYFVILQPSNVLEIHKGKVPKTAP